MGVASLEALVTELGLGKNVSLMGAVSPLEPELQAAIAREQAHNLTAGPQLKTLDQQKLADNARTQKVLQQLSQVEHLIVIQVVLCQYAAKPIPTMLQRLRFGFIFPHSRELSGDCLVVGRWSQR